MRRYEFVNGVLDHLCNDCSCEITRENCQYSAFGVHGICRKCHLKKQRIRSREYKKNNPNQEKFRQIKNKYNLTPDQFNELKTKQEGLCAICRKPNESGRELTVDHDHKTKKVRELLCVKCNFILGNCDDNIEILQKLINYIIKHSDMEKEFTFQHD